MVVSSSITGPSTRYCCVTRLPVSGSLPVEAIVSSPSRLQELQRIARAAGAFLLGDREDFVLEVRLAHVKERLPGHGAEYLTRSSSGTSASTASRSESCRRRRRIGSPAPRGRSSLRLTRPGSR